MSLSRWWGSRGSITRATASIYSQQVRKAEVTNAAGMSGRSGTGPPGPPPPEPALEDGVAQQASLCRAKEDTHLNAASFMTSDDLL